MKKILDLLNKWNKKNNHYFLPGIVIYGDGSGHIESYGNKCIYSFYSVEQLIKYLKYENQNI